MNQETESHRCFFWGTSTVSLKHISVGWVPLKKTDPLIRLTKIKMIDALDNCHNAI